MDIVVDIFVFVVSKSASLKLTNEPTISVLYVLSFERGLRFLIPPISIAYLEQFSSNTDNRKSFVYMYVLLVRVFVHEHLSMCRLGNNLGASSS